MPELAATGGQMSRIGMGSGIIGVEEYSGKHCGKPGHLKR